MVLRLKTRESRSLPGLSSAHEQLLFTKFRLKGGYGPRKRPLSFGADGIDVGFDLRSPVDAGWSSPVARQAHNLKVAGSNPAPATRIESPPAKPAGFFRFCSLSDSLAFRSFEDRR